MSSNSDRLLIGHFLWKIHLLKLRLNTVNSKKKCNFHPITGHEGTDRVERYILTVSLTSAQDDAWLRPRPAALPPGMNRYMQYSRLCASGPVWMGAENLAYTGI